VSVSLKELASRVVPVEDRRRGALVESLSRVVSARLARRVLVAGDTDRQRIERDLHDGVQQRLTGLRLRLAVAAEDFQARGDTDASTALDGFGEEVDQAIDEVRAFAHGLYPAVLVSQGLAAALVSASRLAPGPVAVSTGELGRYRPEVENAVYFTCLAAMDNAAKHAGPGRVSVRVWSTTQALHFSVCDTGCGFDLNRTPAGAGLTNMRDRITALGGTLTLDSSVSHGTRVGGSVPDPWPRTTAEHDPTTETSTMAAGGGPDDEEAAISALQRGSRVNGNGARSGA
jgi:signal transduction histidine kinase